MKISQVRLSDLVAVLNSLTPADVGDVKANRKLNGAIVACETAAKPYFAKLEKLQEEVTAYTKPYQKKMQDFQAKLNEAPEDQKDAISAQMKAVEEEGNAGLAPFNEKMLAFNTKDGDKEVEFAIDPNYLSELKTQFAKHAPAKFKNVKAFIAICDAMGIKDED